MLYRKISKQIENYLNSGGDKVLVVDGARQIGKSFIIREIGSRLFPNFIEINMEKDKQGDRLFAEAKTTENFYLALSAVAGDRMSDKKSTLVFIDEIQAYVLESGKGRAVPYHDALPYGALKEHMCIHAFIKYLKQIEVAVGWIKLEFV